MEVASSRYAVVAKPCAQKTAYRGSQSHCVPVLGRSYRGARALARYGFYHGPLGCETSRCRDHNYCNESIVFLTSHFP